MTCPDDQRWLPSGKVVWGGRFSIVAGCLSHQVDNWLRATDIDASVTLRFTPCPGRGTRVKAC